MITVGQSRDFWYIKKSGKCPISLIHSSIVLDK